MSLLTAPVKALKGWSGGQGQRSGAAVSSGQMA